MRALFYAAGNIFFFVFYCALTALPLFIGWKILMWVFG